MASLDFRGHQPCGYDAFLKVFYLAEIAGCES